MKNGELHVISTGKQPPEQLTDIAASIHPYVDFIHLREKNKSARELHEIVLLLTDKSVPLSKIIINDRIDVAFITKAAGAHLAYHSLPVDRVKQSYPFLKVGCSVHSYEESALAEKQGADFLLYGHIFPTDSKPGLHPRGLKTLKKLANSCALPVIAIGGIKPFHVQDIINTGARGIAVMSGIMEAKNPLEAVKEYYDSLTT